MAGVVEEEELPGLGEQALTACLAGGWLAPGALVVLEEDAKTEIAAVDGLEELDRRTVGESQFVIYRSA